MKLNGKLRIIYIIGWGILTFMIVNDFVLLRIWAPPDDVLPYSRTLQAVLDLTTRLFDGQGVSAAILDDDKGYWAGTSGYSEPAKLVEATMLFNIMLPRWIWPSGLRHSTVAGC